MKYLIKRVSEVLGYSSVNNAISVFIVAFKSKLQVTHLMAHFMNRNSMSPHQGTTVYMKTMLNYLKVVKLENIGFKGYPRGLSPVVIIILMLAVC